MKETKIKKNKWTGIGYDDKGSELVPTKDDYGFIYVISIKSPEDGRWKKYIGQKRFWKTVTYPPLKNKVNKRKLIKPSDWENYYSSSAKTQKWIEDGQPFVKKILWICKSKWEANYVELFWQLDCDVNVRNDYLNSMINVRQSGCPDTWTLGRSEVMRECLRQYKASPWHKPS